MWNRSRAKVIIKRASAFAALTAAILAATGGFVNCSAQPEAIGTQAQRQVLGSSHTGTTNSSVRSVSAVWAASPASVGFMNVVAGYEDTLTTQPSLMGWSDSATGLGTFTKCNALTPGCGTTCSAIMVDGGTTPTTTRPPPGGVVYLGNPSLATDGQGNVVYVSLAGVNGATSPNGIVASISTDGGLHFSNTVVVNSDKKCSGGTQDEPNVTFDTTTVPPTLWVVWRHEDTFTFGGCVRHGILDLKNGPPDACGNPLPIVQWLGNGFAGNSQVVNHMDHDFGAGANSQGGMMIQAGDGAVTVVYSGNDQVPAFCDTSTKQTSWGSVTTYDNGVTWTNPNPSFFYTSPNYSYCVLDGPSGATATFSNGLRDFGFVRASNGRYYAAVHDTKATIRLFESVDKGDHWREYCPSGIGTSPAPKNDAQSSNWLQTGFVCPKAAIDVSNGTDGGAGSQSLAWPTLAADGETNGTVGAFGFVHHTFHGQMKSRVALTFLASNAQVIAPLDTAWNTMIVTDTDPITAPGTFDGGIVSLATVLQPTALPTGLGLTSNIKPPLTPTAYGDYMSLAVLPSNGCTEIPTMDDSGVTTQVLVQCAESSFWPFWTAPDVPGTAIQINDTQIFTTDISP